MSSLFQSKRPASPTPVKPPSVQAPQMPALPTPTRMPTIANASDQARAARESALRRRGRMSTILTDREYSTSSIGGA